MGLLLIFPLLVSGYLFCIYNPVIFSSLHRYEGQLLYLLVARHGFNCLIAATLAVSLLVAALSHTWPSFCAFEGSELCVRSFSTDFLSLIAAQLTVLGLVDEMRSQVSAFVILVGLATIVVPKPWARFLYARYKKANGLRSNAAANTFLLGESVRGLPIRAALVESLSLQLPIMVSMEDRKVYVGIVSSIGTPDESSGPDEDFGLFPVASGFRDKDDLRVNYTLQYPEVTDETLPIFFKQEAIVSLTTYNETLAKNLATQLAEKSSTCEEVSRGSALQSSSMGLFTRWYKRSPLAQLLRHFAPFRKL